MVQAGDLPQKDDNVVNVEEEQYLNLIRKIIKYGNERIDRTKVGTLSLFGEQMRFSLSDGRIPLLTTKRVFFRGVVEELVWFIKGCTDSIYLQERDVHIWDGNGSKEFLEKRGLGHREVGDLGPVYGFQWRHMGATYVDKHYDYRGKGLDQLQRVIDTIKSDPHSDSIILSAWNPVGISHRH